MEEVLLGDPLVSSGTVREAIRIEELHHPPHPDVDWETLHPAAPVKQGAVRDLDPHASDPGEHRAGFGKRQGAAGFQIYLPGNDLLCRIHQIAGAKSRTQRGEVGRGTGGDRFRRGEREPAALGRLPQ